MLQSSYWGEDKNCTLIMFDNVGSGDADSGKLNPKQSGELQLQIRFNTSLGESKTS